MDQYFGGKWKNKKKNQEAVIGIDKLSPIPDSSIFGYWIISLVSY
jgi:hypothetical protein